MRRWLVAAALVVVLAIAAVVGLDATGHLPESLGGSPARTPIPSATASSPPTPTPSPAASVLGPVSSSAGAPTAAGVAAALAPVLRAPALAGPGALVLDAASGTELYRSAPDRARIPASTAKLLTAAAVLSSDDPGTTLRTRVVAGASAGQVVLVGGGDPSLTDRPVAASAYPRPATLDALAAATATALGKQGRTAVTLMVDDTLFGGPRRAPGWQPAYLPSGVVAPVSALVVDEARVRPGKARRVGDPAREAGQAFATRLAAHGIRLVGPVTRGAAPAGAAEIAGVDSPPLSVLVESMLARSDNDYAEALARHVAVVEQLPATFAGVAQALPRALLRLGLDVTGLALADGSGLSRSSRVPPRLLADVLRAAYGQEHLELRPIMSGLPVAGFSGTLLDRFGAATDRPAIGTVRAKTGTLTGVSSLAGVVVDADGAPLVFVLMADAVPVPKTLAARAALDLGATRLAACGCR